MNEKSQYKIYIDTTDRKEKKISLISSDGAVVDSIQGNIDEVSTIKNLLEKHSLEPSDILTYDVNAGPGSFTGLKIGVTIANTLNWALGKKKTSELVQPQYGQEPNIHPTSWIEK